MPRHYSAKLSRGASEGSSIAWGARIYLLEATGDNFCSCKYRLDKNRTDRSYSFSMSVMHSTYRIISFAPRAYLFTRSLRPRSFKTSTRHSSQSKPASFESFKSPSPPRLPKEEQEIYEALQRQSTGAFSTPRAPPQINQSPDATEKEVLEARANIEDRKHNVEAEASPKDLFEKQIEAKGKGEELHPNVRRGATPEFEGDVNPQTGEVGGPKNNPLRWGAAGEWSYNGRTTDF